jgi:hypothetical protein
LLRVVPLLLGREDDKGALTPFPKFGVDEYPNAPHPHRRNIYSIAKGTTQQTMKEIFDIQGMEVLPKNNELVGSTDEIIGR